MEGAGWNKLIRFLSKTLYSLQLLMIGASTKRMRLMILSYASKKLMTYVLDAKMEALAMSITNQIGEKFWFKYEDLLPIIFIGFGKDYN